MGGPGTGKTWTYVSLLSELLYENKFRVLIVTPENQMLDGVAVRIHKTFQPRPSLKNKIICCVKSKDLVAKSSQITRAQLPKFINKAAGERGDVVLDKNILAQVMFNTRMVECIKGPGKYNSLKQLKDRLCKGPTDKRIQELNRPLKKAKAETLRDVDIALITFCQRRKQVLP
jgi:Rad3-related DNA helicase